MKKKEKQKAGDKFRQRIAFNLAKECLLGGKHDASMPQEDLFLTALASSSLAPQDGDQLIGIRTYKRGWLGEQRPQRWVQILLDEIVTEFGENTLCDWNLRINQNKLLHERKLQIALDNIASSEGVLAYTMERQGKIFQESAKAALERSKLAYEELNLSGDYSDGIYVGYFPGIDTTPSRWINRSAINDVLHEHLVALDVACMDYSATNIIGCNKLLYRIHERWNPHGANCFFECMEFGQSDFIQLDENDYLRKTIELKRYNDQATDGLDKHIFEKFIVPDNVYQTYDVFSPAKISEFLTSIPISKNISEHPLLDFWVLEFASSVAAFYWLVEAYRRRDGAYKIRHEQSIKTLDMVSFCYGLLWGGEDLEQCLCRLDIFPKSVFYEDYFDAFTIIRNKYHEILNHFGINVSEVQKAFEEFHNENAVVFVPRKY
jgi:hypothetical protein